MYQDYYGLDSDPFRLSPDHKFCLRHPTFNKAKAYMQFAVHRAEGFVMITGRPGTGKTTLIEDLLSDVDGREVLAAKLVSAQLHADDLLQMAAFNFGINGQGKSKSALLMEMQGFFAERIADGHRPLLVIDEAQGLSLGAMEELRLLTNLRINGQPMLQIFLVGQEELRDLVLDPRMEQLHQRMIASCHLEPLDVKQCAAYVMHRLKTAGWRGRPRLRADVFPLLYRFSQGVPRRINTFMSRLMLFGALEGRDELNAGDAQVVLEELKSEHLTPVRSNELFDQNPPPQDSEDIDEELLMPDQKIGARLIARQERERRQRSSQPSAAPPTRIERFLPERPPDPATPDSAVLLQQAADVPPSRPSPTAGTPASHASGSLPRCRCLAGLAFSLLMLVLVLGPALLLGPLHAPKTGVAASLWEKSGLGNLRSRVHRWSGGMLPLFSTPGVDRTPPPVDSRGASSYAGNGRGLRAQA